ncbi:MAG: nucleotidyltransferase family protein [Steroidobacteraceae bacterium]
MDGGALRNSAFEEPGLWPSTEQKLVLRAALGDRCDSGTAFAAWRRDLDESKPFDHEIARLLPLLYDNLRRWDCKDGLMDRLKGAYRMNWVKVQTLFAQLRPPLEGLAVAGVDIIMLKGAPLAVAYYRTPATRPMMDIDIAVPANEVSRCLAVLGGLGWTPRAFFCKDVLRLRNALAIYGPDGQEFDLHWRILPEFSDPRADAEFRRHSVPFQFLGQAVHMPDATRMLVHSVFHGVRWNAEPTVRWLADATFILRNHAGEIDWDWLADFARRWQMSHRLGLGLAYLAEHLGAQIPLHVLQTLRMRRPTWVERVESRTLLRDERAVYAGMLGPIALPFGDYVRFIAGANPIRAAWDFVVFLRIYWGLRRRREIAGYLWRGIKARWRRALHGR